MKYLKRLNWSGFLFVLALCILASMLRKDESIYESLLVGSVGGFLGGLFFLFGGMDDKK